MRKTIAVLAQLFKPNWNFALWNVVDTFLIEESILSSEQWNDCNEVFTSSLSIWSALQHQLTIYFRIINLVCINAKNYQKALKTRYIVQYSWLLFIIIEIFFYVQIEVTICSITLSSKLSIATSLQSDRRSQSREKYLHELILKYTSTLVILESFVMEYTSIENYQ